MPEFHLESNPIKEQWSSIELHCSETPKIGPFYISKFTLRIIGLLIEFNIRQISTLRELGYSTFPRWIRNIIAELAHCPTQFTHAHAARPVGALDHPVMSTFKPRFSLLPFV
jgi:hypothetical protein